MLDILIRGSSGGGNRISYPTASTVIATVLLYLFYPTRLPRRNPLANLVFPPTSLSLTFLLTIYIYIATSGDPVTVSIRALSRDSPSGRYKWKFRFLSSLDYPRESTARRFIGRIYMSRFLFSPSFSHLFLDKFFPREDKGVGK